MRLTCGIVRVVYVGWSLLAIIVGFVASLFCLCSVVSFPWGLLAISALRLLSLFLLVEVSFCA